MDSGFMTALPLPPAHDRVLSGESRYGNEHEKEGTKDFESPLRVTLIEEERSRVSGGRV